MHHDDSIQLYNRRENVFHQDLQKQKAQAGIIIFINLSTIGISPQVNLARWSLIFFFFYFTTAGLYFTRQEDLILPLDQFVHFSQVCKLHKIIKLGSLHPFTQAYTSVCIHER